MTNDQPEVDVEVRDDPVEGVLITGHAVALPLTWEETLGLGLRLIRAYAAHKEGTR